MQCLNCVFLLILIFPNPHSASSQKMWPKSTVEGVRSAISSRRVMAKTMQIQFQRIGESVGESELVQEFELSISRPMGIHIEGTYRALK